MLNRNFVNIIGCGYAGIEAALFLAGHGIKVHIFSDKISKSEDKTLQKDNLYNRLLAEELSILGSPIVRKAEQFEQEKVEKCIEQLLFSHALSMVKDNENIEFFPTCVYELNPNEINIIATGPNTNQDFFQHLINKFGSIKCFYGLPVFPVLSKIKEDKLLKKSDEEFLLPLEENEFLSFVNETIKQAKTEAAENTEFKVLPNTIEEFALFNKENLRIYSMMPHRMQDLQKHYAMVALRKVQTGYEIQNLFSSLPQDRQVQIFQTLDAFKNCKVVKAGQVQKGTFINSSSLLNQFGQCKSEEGIFFAGGILGLDGHLNAIASGLWTAMNVYKFIQGKRMIPLGEDCSMGKLIRKLNKETSLKIRPILRGCDMAENQENLKFEIEIKKSIKALEKFKEDYKNGKYV